MSRRALLFFLVKRALPNPCFDSSRNRPLDPPWIDDSGLQEFVAQYDFNNEKFDRMVFEMESTELADKEVMLDIMGRKVFTSGWLYAILFLPIKRANLWWIFKYMIIVSKNAGM